MLKKIIKKSLRKKLFYWKSHNFVIFLYFKLKFAP